jgi:hypothetical protein
MDNPRGTRIDKTTQALMMLCDPTSYLPWDEPDWLTKRPPAGFQIVVGTPNGPKNKFAELMDAAEERE